MLLELGIPQGQIVSRWRGGDDVFMEALGRIQGVSFTGYLKVSLSKDGERSEGLISFNSAAPSISIYVFQPSGMEEIWSLGDKSTEMQWHDSLQPEAVVSLHADVSLKDFESLFPLARVKRIGAPSAILDPAELRKAKMSEAESNENMVKVIRSGLNNDVDRKKADQQAQGVYDLILQYHKMSSNGSRISQCSECGGPIDLLGYCPSCASRSEGRGIAPRMDQRFTFDSFVVGQNSRFAEAAARAVASDPGHLYNPLLIHGRSGLGKTHLMQAIGHQLKKEHKNLSVVYLPLETSDEELLKAIVNRSEELSEELEEADLLLIDDVQFLSGKDRLQEEILRIMNSLITKGRQVVLTSDRPPKDIPSLGDRFESRIESGLVVDMQQPDSSTRLGILKKVVEEEGLNIPEQVMVFVAEMCPDNVRQLEGGMNKVIAFASLMRSDITLDIAKEVLDHEKASVHHRKIELLDRHSYLVEEERPVRSYDLLVHELDKGYKGLIFSRSNPAVVRERIGNREASVYWLTEHESKEEQTVPPSLEKIILQVEDFLTIEGGTIILLDDLHYLISNATFDGVIRFVRSVVDQVSERPSIFLLSISPDSLKLQERSILEREMEPLRF